MTAVDATRSGPAHAPPAPASWALGRRLRVVLLALALVVGLLSALIAVAGTRFVLAGNAVVYRWSPARLAGERVMEDLVDQETGVRGYLLTRTRVSLQPYLEYLPAQRTDTRRLEHLIGSDERISVLVHRMQRRAEQWRSEFATPVIAALDAHQPTSSEVTDAGKASFDEIRVAAAQLDAALTRREDSALRARVAAGIVAGIAFAVGLVLGAAAVLTLWRGLHRWVLRPIGELAGQTRTVAAGELHRTIEPAGPRELIDLGADVEAMRARIVAELARAERITEDLQIAGEELERSNSDLRQFAYVASHDLSEPLRKVSNFCQLLERQYAPQLDDRARQYIDFAVDGAKRMQALINDLLALSRVGRSTDSFVPVDLDAALTTALSTLSDRIAATGARIERRTPLPTVDGDRSLLVSLLENLVGNAVKYHRDDAAPVVELSASRLPDGAGWQLRVSDNGIGIDAQYAERIFAVFQRLHLRDQYGGTGIGLALCRRITEFHGGHIQLETDVARPTPGATFLLTLPEGHRAELVR